MPLKSGMYVCVQEKENKKSMKGEDQRAPWSPNQPNQNAPPNNAPPNTLQTINQNQALRELSIAELNNIINALSKLHRQLNKHQNPPK